VITAVAFCVFAGGATVGLCGKAWAVLQPRVDRHTPPSGPFHVGQLVRIRSGALGSVLDGTVTEIGITYVHLDTGEGVLALPSSQVLAAAAATLPAEVASQPGWLA
jgi:hypothetical protein